MNQAIKDCDFSELSACIQSTGIYLNTGPFTYHIKTALPIVHRAIHLLYGDHEYLPESDFADFHISLAHSSSIRRWLKPKIKFFMDGHSPFDPMAEHQAQAFFEWGMNWCVSTQPNSYLKMHAAVLEKDGCAVILPGAPGAGKSTLSAALLLKGGWRLLSDEHALVSFSEAMVTPICRPVSLKNESIQIIKEFAPRAVIGPLSEDTHKGTVAHLKADIGEDSLQITPVKAAWLIFPRYSPGAQVRLEIKSKAESFIKAAQQSFNYSLLGEIGFRAMADLVTACQCYDFVYSDLTEALDCFNRLER